MKILPLVLAILLITCTQVNAYSYPYTNKKENWGIDELGNWYAWPDCRCGCYPESENCEDANTDSHIKKLDAYTFLGQPFRPKGYEKYSIGYTNKKENWGIDELGNWYAWPDCGGCNNCHPTPVPEPTTIFLFGSGLIGLAHVIKRKGKPKT